MIKDTPNQQTIKPVPFDSRDWAIIADDLTGANDIGSQFISPEQDVLVVFDPRRLDELWSKKTLVIVDLETRDEKIQISRKLGEKAVKSYKKSGVKNIFLKIDTCFRGNVAAQIEAVVAGFGNGPVMVLPAIPEMKRYTVNGAQFIDGIPISAPVRSVTTSNIKSLLSEDTGLKIGNVTLPDIKRGIVEKRIRGLLKEGVKIIVCDSKTNEHIGVVTEAIFDSGLCHIFAGSIGLAGGIAEYFGFGKQNQPLYPNNSSVIRRQRKEKSLPLAIIAGSYNSVTKKQVAYAKSTGMEVVEVHLSKIKRNMKKSIGTTVSAIKNLLAKRSDVIVSTTQSEFCALGGFSKIITTALGEIGAKIAVGCGVSAIVVTGGEISYSLCRNIGSAGIRVCRKIAPGVVAGEIAGGLCPGLRIITKGGSVGTASLFKDIKDTKFW